MEETTEKKIRFKLVTCDHYEAARIYVELADNKLSEIRGFRSSVEKNNGYYAVYLEGDESAYADLEAFLGNIIVRLFFF